MSKHVFFTGGGTGGHIYPGLAVADELVKLDSEITVHYIGAKRPLDMAILEKSKYEKHFLNIGPVNTSNKIKRIFGLAMIPLALLQALLLLLKYKPKFVIGFGGYAAFPALYAAYLLRIPTMIWEANAYPGMVSRLMAKKVSQVFLNLPDVKKLYSEDKVQVTGIPTRFVAQAKAKKDKFQVLIFGGSSGARSINHAIYDLMQEISEAGEKHSLSDIHFVHQIGMLDYEKFTSMYESVQADVEVLEFIHNMPEQLAKADLVICRAGVSTIAEICMSETAAIMVPLPSAADNHQYENAKVLSDAQAGILLEQKDMTSRSLENLILSLKNEPKLREGMQKNLAQFVKHGAANKMAERLLDFT